MTARSSSVDSLVRAADLLASGAWNEAHEIVQDDTSRLGAWLHGIVHTLEGDLANAQYWYREAHREFPGPEHVREEIAAAQREVRGAGT